MQFLTNVSFTGWNRGWKLSDSMIRKAIRFALLVVMLGSGRVTAQVTEGFYRIVSNSDNTFYLCPAQDPDNLSVVYRVNGNLMLTTKKNPPEADYTVWRIKGGSGDNADYYQIVHQSSGQYIINDCGCQDETDGYARRGHRAGHGTHCR